ncbi:hypothetical protein NX059_007881 [Plenodomus lindquistii]|nr:hypothetical protein NX059_007881 [Plenodomus lindquistii]
MDASLASHQARLATFTVTTTSKARRTSNRIQKAAPKSKSAWPHSSPSPQDLAFAGFVWKPTTTSPDNVQCFSCACQLDGWEEPDVPAFEHLTHSPSCGFAIVTCIRLRNGDPGRTEDDPSSDAMLNARRDTFRDNWPLEHEPGYPNADQMAAAGWMFDPAEDTPDGVTCPYCSLALDAWDAGDDPYEEHRRRAQDCLFFTLTELYHPQPADPAPAKGKGKGKAPAKGKRTSTRTSTSSVASTSSNTRGTRARKTPAGSMVVQPPKQRTRNTTVASKVVKPAPKRTRSTTISSTLVQDTQQPPRQRRVSNASSTSSSSSSVYSATASSAQKARSKVEKTTSDDEKPRFKTRFSNTGKGKGKKATVNTNTAIAVVVPTQERQRRISNASSTSSSSSLYSATASSTQKAKGKVENPASDDEKPRFKTRFSNTGKGKKAVVKKDKGKKRASEEMEVDNVPEIAGPSEVTPPTQDKGKKRASEHIAPDSAPRMGSPSKRFRSSSFSSLPDDLPVGTPKKTPTHLRETEFEVSSLPSGLPGGTPKQTPSRAAERAPAWTPTDAEELLRGEQIDAEDLAAMTEEEKSMTVEQWMLFNAKREAEKLRGAMRMQIAAFDAVGDRAIATLEALPTV